MAQQGHKKWHLPDGKCLGPFTISSASLKIAIVNQTEHYKAAVSQLLANGVHVEFRGLHQPTQKSIRLFAETVDDAGREFFLFFNNSQVKEMHVEVRSRHRRAV